MKILFVAHSFPRNAQDVAGSFLLSLASGLIGRGHEVTAVVPHDAGLHSRDGIQGVRVRRFRYGPDGKETLAYTGTMADQVMKSWGSRLRLLSFLRACRRETRLAAAEWKPDVVHAHWWFPAGLALLGPGAPQAPAVLTSHGTDLFLLDRKKIARGLASRVFRAAEKVTVISNPLVDRVASLGVEPGDISVVPMPVDRALLDSPRRSNEKVEGRSVQLLFVGRLTERKGAEYAIRALKLLNSRGVKAELTLIGDGPLRVELDSLCDELDLGTSVHFLGMLPPSEVISRMRTADVFLMPAVTDWKGEQEGFGMVIVEAMFCGVPVVASASGGITDIIRDGENGILVEERNVEGLAAAVVRVARNTGLASKLTDAARQSVLQQFHPDAIAARFEDIYLSAVNAAR